jgi:hypothetical protein
MRSDKGSTTLLPLLTCRTAHWSDLMGDAEFLDRTDEHAVQQLADKIRAAGRHSGARAVHVQSCVEIFRADDDMILKVRDIASVAQAQISAA